MRISKKAIEEFEKVGSDAGSVHRVCCNKYGVYPRAAAEAINKIAINGMTHDTRMLHLKVFETAKSIDSKLRKEILHDFTEIHERLEKLESRGILKWLENIFHQEQPLLW